jgi:2-polyprenyl-6-methoxyphenol hydroxylase-like FAD-dependent oxidoreductase
MSDRTILISGAGIAGLTLAYWLKRYGFEPTVVEVAPTLRAGGYAVDFWGAGFDVAERMGIIPALEKADVGITEMAFVDADNKRRGGMDYRKLKEMMDGRAFTLLRSELSMAIHDHLDKGIEIIFGDAIHRIGPRGEDVLVNFRNGAVRPFDLVIGADGLHSTVRELVFGPEEQIEKYYGYYTASYTIQEGMPTGSGFLGYNVPGKQAALYSLGGGKAATFFIFASPSKLSYGHHDTERQKEVLRGEFQEAGWKCVDLLSKMDQAPDFYFDVVSQVRMEHWSQGRVALVGDAAYCPSLLSGQGSTLAMVGAYILAGELKEAKGDHATAFVRYQQLFKPFIDRKQKVAQTFAGSLVPKSKFGIWLRNSFTNLMFLPFVSKLFIKQFMDDGLHLKDYG